MRPCLLEAAANSLAAADIARNGVSVQNVTQVVSGVLGQLAHETPGESVSEGGAPPEGCGTTATCFVAGTSVLAFERTLSDTLLADRMGADQAYSFEHLFASFSAEERRELGLGLIVLGGWGAYLIRRINEESIAKRSRAALADVELVEMPLRQKGSRRRGRSWPGPFGNVFSVRPILE